MRFLTTLIFILLLFGLSQTTQGQNCVPTLYTFSGENYAGDFKVDNHPAGGYLLAGEVNNTAADSGIDIHIIRSDDFGNEIWSNTYSWPGNEGCAAIRALPDGSAVILGTISDESIIDADSEILLMKIDAEGNQLWFRTYGTIDEGQYSATDLELLPDGGFALTGVWDYTEWSLDPGFGIMILADDSGQELASREVHIGLQHEQNGGEEPAMPDFKNVTRCANGDLVFSGWALSPSDFWPSRGNFVAIRTDANLNTQWEVTQAYGSCLAPVGWDMVETEDGRLFFASDMEWTGCFDINGYTAMMEVSADGAEINFHPLDYLATGGRSMLLAEDGDLVIGRTNSIMKVRTDGTVLWESPTVANFYGNSGNVLVPNAIGGYMLSVWNSDEIWLVQFDSFGNNCQNRLAGEVYYDADGNCERDDTEQLLSDVMVELNPGEEFANTTDEGYYRFQCGVGTYTVTATPPNELWTIGCPPTESHEVELFEIYDYRDELDFGLQAQEVCSFLEIDARLSRARVCTEQWVNIQYCNYGTATAEGAFVNLELPAELQFVDAEIPWTVVDGNYRFEIGAVAVYECGSFNVNVYVDCDAELGTEVCTEVQIFPENTCTLVAGDGQDVDCALILNSYDPNDKLAVAADTVDCWTTALDELEFTIRFQNTGNDTAYNVVIIDTLTEDLDLTTFRPGPSSHAYEVRVLHDRQLMFSFPNINLLDSMSNLLASQGFVQFSIYPVANIADGTIIRNRAGIYFDSNPPIITPELAFFQCAEVPLTIVEVVAEDISDCENPNGQLTVIATGGQGNYEYSIDDGENWQPEPLFTNLEVGTYEVRLRDEAGTTRAYEAGTVELIELVPFILNSYATAPSSCGGNSGRIYLEIESEVPTQISVDGENWLPSNTFYALSAGVYQVQVANACFSGPTITEEVPALEPPSIQAITTTNPDCDQDNGSITIEASGVRSLRYSLDNGESWTSNGDFNNVLAGTYQPLVAYGPTNCVVSLDSTVTLSNGTPLPTDVEVTAVDPSPCGGTDGQVEFTTAGSSVSYSIDGGATFQSEPLFTNLNGGVYQTVISNNCDLTEMLGTVELTSTPLPVITDVEVLSANCGATDGSIVITASGGEGLEFSLDNWQSTQSTNEFMDLAAGTYEIGVRNGSDCYAELATVEITSTEAPVITNVDTTAPSCGADDGNIVVSAIGGENLEYSLDSWQTIQTSSEFTGLSAGTYGIDVRNSDGCYVELWSVELVAPAPPIIAMIDVVQPSCEEPFGEVNIVASSDEVLQYSIVGMAGPWSSASSFVDLAPGSYEVVVANSFGNCAVSAAGNPLVLNAPEFPALLSVNTVDASGGGVADGQIVINASGSTDFLYSIDGGVNWQENNVFEALLPGAYLPAVAWADTTCIVDFGEVTISFTNRADELAHLGVQTFKVFPNPTNEQSTLEIEFNEKHTIAAELLSLTGQLLRQLPRRESARYVQTIDLSMYPAGAYYLKVQVEDEIVYRLLIKQ